jgi:glycosyltransferase involved in cell wall biosynthesis
MIEKTKNKLSAVIITFNEEKNIERCIESLIGLADEIVVLDSFSTDKTEEICKKHNVNFFQHKFDGHIEQKNRAITYAKHPYIVSLDADEAISPELKKSILEEKNNWQADGYKFNRLTNYCGKWIKYCGWYPDRKLRLWNPEKGNWTGINPHDEYKMEEGSSVKFLKGDLYHYSYYTIEDHYKQVEKFTDISAKAYFEKNIKSNFLKIAFKPIWKFIKDYIFKLGFLDGYLGFKICSISAKATYIKYRKIKNLQKT